MTRDRSQDESRRVIERVGAETEARMSSPATSSPADGGDDWAEMWGKRIGRVMSFVLLGLAVVWLYNLMMGTG